VIAPDTDFRSNSGGLELAPGAGPAS